MKTLKLISFIIIVFNCCKAAKAADTLFVDKHNNYKILPHLDYIEDISRTMPIGTAVNLFNSGKYQKTPARTTFNAGLTYSAFWFKIVIKNTDKNSRLLFLGIHERVDTLWLYHQIGNTIKREVATGFNYPYATRPVPNRNFIFKIAIPAGSTFTYYLRARNTTNYIYMPFALKDADEYLAYETSRYQLLGVYTGIFIFAIIFSLLLYISAKDKLHLWYAFYVFASLVYLMMEDGVTYEFVLRDLPGLKWLLDEQYWWYGLMLLWLYVMQLFVNQTRVTSRFYWVTKFTIVLLGFLILSEFIIGTFSLHANTIISDILNHGGDIVFFAGCILLLIGTAEQAIRRSTAAIIYLVAISCGVLGTLIIFLNYLGLTNINPVEPNGMVVGLAIEIIILSFALTIRFNILRKEKERLLVELNKQQEQLTEKIVHTQEQERRRLAEDLHDDVGATLSALQLHISNISDKQLVENPSLNDYYTRALALVTKATNDVRSVSHDLLPKDFSEVGLFDIIQNRVNELNHTTSTSFEFVYEGDEGRINDIYAITIYRIINELLNNIIKHADAAEATIQVSVLTDSLQIIAEDNGIGMNHRQNKKGIGLQNIQSRVGFLKGTLITDSGAGGTTYIINIPI